MIVGKYGTKEELPVSVSSGGTAHRKDYLETSIGNRIQKPGSADRCMKPECSLN